MGQKSPDEVRIAMVRAFVRRTFGLAGTLRIHRSAISADLLRAPLNVALAPVFLLVRLLALLARLLRLPDVANWLARRKVLLKTNAAEQVKARLLSFLARLEAQGLYKGAPQKLTHQAIEDYVGVRNAVAEIVTTCLILICGYLLFRTAMPGVISLAGPVAEMQAQTKAVENFWLGERLGRTYYGVFSTELSVWQIIGTGVVLAMIASVFTTFAGVIADPLQVLTGTHRRRIQRLLGRLEAFEQSAEGLAKEHVAARSADVMDIVLNVWRSWRG